MERNQLRILQTTQIEKKTIKTVLQKLNRKGIDLEK